MRTRSQLAILMVAAVATGCVRHFEQPTLYEPHANVQLRAVHHAQLGPLVDEHVEIDGDTVGLSETADGVSTTTMRVRPESTSYDFHTEFFHEETRWETQTYNMSQSYLCGSTQFGPQYCNYEFPTTRTVPIMVRVPDGGCDARFNHVPVPGAAYLLQYELIADGLCQVTCQRLLEGPNGSVLSMPCGPGEPASGQLTPAGSLELESVPPAIANEPPAPETSGDEAEDDIDAPR